MDPRVHAQIDAQRRADLARRAEEHALARRLAAERVPPHGDALLARLRRLWRELAADRISARDDA